MDSAEYDTGQDRLARILHTLRMRSTFYCHAELSDPWSLAMPAIADSVSFHIVTSGSCWLRLPGDEAIELRVGDLALVSHGLGHDLLSAQDSRSGPRVDLLPQKYLSRDYSLLRYGGSGRPVQLICGVVSFDDPAARELMRTLPTFLIVGDSSASSSIRDTLRLMAGELARPQLGGEAVATRLADILVVQAIRGWLASDDDNSTGWLRALRDERIGRAIEAIHDEPGLDWSIDRLSQLATMSRSSFIHRFGELVGVSPIAYLTRWRMSIAHSRLAEEDITVTRLAGELGYRSEAAFNRAFTRAIGTTPGSIRRHRDRPPEWNTGPGARDVTRVPSLNATASADTSGSSANHDS